VNHRILAAACLAAATLSACGTALTPRGLQNASGDAQARAIANDLLVAYKPGVAAGSVQRLSQEMGLRTVKAVNPLRMQVVRTTGNAQEALRKLKSRPEVAWVEVNSRESLPPLRAHHSIPATPRNGEGDPLLAEQWGLAKVQAQAAWATTPGKKETVLAIIDTGIDYNHPDLAGRVIKGRDFVNNDDDPMDGHAHGTHCAGIAGATANNGIGIAGVAPGVTLMAVKVLSDQGSGTTDGVCAGIVWAADNGAHVISLSLGGAGGKQAKQAAVDYARSKGAVVVAAMGNNGGNVAVYPGASDGVIAVGSTSADDTRSSFSNFGDWITVGAPGHQILSTVPGGGYKAYSGTSMATPHVAGLAALLHSANPGMSADAITERIKQTADDIGPSRLRPAVRSRAHQRRQRSGRHARAPLNQAGWRTPQFIGVGASLFLLESPHAAALPARSSL
jgi:thermitase